MMQLLTGSADGAHHVLFLQVLSNPLQRLSSSGHFFRSGVCTRLPTTLIRCGPSFLTIHHSKHFILAINRGWCAEWTSKTVQTCQRANVLFCVGTQMGVA